MRATSTAWTRSRLRSAILTGALTIGPIPAESGFTDCFLMGAIASGSALLAAVPLPGRAAAQSGPGA